MSERTKMILKIVGLFLSAGLIGYLLYRLFFGGGPLLTEPTPVTPPTTTGGGLPTSGAAGERPVTPTTPGAPGLPPSAVAAGGPTLITTLTAAGITSPTVSGNNVNYYDPRDGKFYTIDKNGNTVALSDATFPQAQTVNFDQAATKVALEFPDGSNVLYDFATGSQTTLPSHWEEFSWSTDGSQVVSKSLGTDPSNRALVITNADGSQTKVITALGDNADKVTASPSPSGNVVAFSETGSAQASFGRREIYLIDQNGLANESIIVDGTNFSAVWAPSGAAILYSVADVTNNSRATMWYATVGGNGERRNLGVETWVEKCVFADEATVYCAVPRVGTNLSGADHRVVSSPDDLYLVNVVNGKKTLIAQPAIDTQLTHLSLSDDQSLLYFTDVVGRLNYLRLK